MLSGPLLLYDIKLTDQQYLLFGEKHASGGCNIPCADISLTGDVLDTESAKQCQWFSYWLSNLFKETDQPIEFYLEIPFRPKGKRYISKDEVKDMYLGNRQLSLKLFYLFYDCFVKKTCPYPHVHFHYIDPRNYIAGGEVYIRSPPNSFQESLSTQEGNILRAVRTRNPYIIDHVVQLDQQLELYYGDFHSVIWNLILSSDDFLRDIAAITTKLPVLESALDFTTIVSKLRGKTIHRIRKQLLLSSPRIARLLYAFAVKKYWELVPVKAILTAWRVFYTHFTTLIKTTPSEEDIKTLAKEFYQAIVLIGTDESFELSLDIYTLGRMVRRRAPIHVSLTGAFHTRIMAEFFGLLTTDITVYPPDAVIKENTNLIPCLHL